MVVGIDASRAFIDQPTGTERYAFEVITRMLRLPEAKKHEWVLYVKQNQSSKVKSQKFNSKVKVTEIPLPYLWTQGGLAARTWIDKLDVLWVPAHTLPVLRKPGMKTVVTIHGIEYEWLPAYENALQRWYLPWSTIYAVRSATKVIAVSEFTKKQLIERLNADQKKIEVILEGYEDNFQFSINNLQKVSNNSIFKQYNLKPKKYLLFVGTVQPRKNLEKLIKVFARIIHNSQRDPSTSVRMTISKDLKLVIAGKLGWTYDDVISAPERYGIKDRVIITGYMDNEARKQLLSGALVYAQPSVTEGFGIPVLEAMSEGVAVVSSNGGALPEVVRNAGLLFDPMSEEEMERQITKLLSDRNLRDRLAGEGRVVVESFSWEKAARETLNYLVG